MDDQLKQLTPAWLTDLLRSHGHLAHGQVTALCITNTFETPPSTHAQLIVAYSPDAPADAPTRLFVKMPKPHKLARGKREVDFYATIAPKMPAVPLVPCFGTRYNAETGMSYLLLADVSATHSTIEGGALSWFQIESMVNVLAHLHATWWNYPKLVNVAGESPQDDFTTDFANNDRNYRELVEQLGGQLTTKERQIFERFLVDAPALLLKRASSQALTLCHPENHRGNFLFPQQPEGRVYIIDWHQYRCWWGAKDIVGLVNRSMALDQLDRTKHLLRTYYERLIEYGVTNYSWEECRQDYRLGVIDYLTVPLQYQLAIQNYPAFFKRLFAAIMHEFQAWECAELLL